MQHRLLALLTGAALLLGLCVPAMGASESADERLKSVTQRVKDTLDLDTEAYDEFRGDVSEQELRTIWHLNWSGDGVSLSIEALEDGTILNYWRSDEDGGDWIYYRNRSLPALPKTDVEAAKQAAGAFLDRVLDKRTERAELGEPASATQLNSSACRFYGKLLLNGLPSPLSYSISVRGSDNTVTSFSRDAAANAYLGGVPSPVPAVTADAAAKALRDTLKLELVYVTDGDDSEKAVLRYVPADEKTQYVDAQTGRLVSPADTIYYGDAAAAEMAMDGGTGAANSKRALTQAELTGIEKLEGALSGEALDKLVRAEAAYGLDGFTLSGADFRTATENERELVYCTLRYSAPEDEEGYVSSRSFTVNARTGEVLGLYGYEPWDRKRESSVSLDEARSAAEAFFGRYSAHAAEFELRGTDDRTAEGAASYGFTFTRKVNGIFYPENACVLQISRFTGAVTGLSYGYTEKLAFDSPSGVISAAEALDAWMATYDVALGYRSVQKQLDAASADEDKLISLGYTQFPTLLLCYALERETHSAGIDAKTGRSVEAPQEDGTIAYNDLQGHWAAEQIEALAKFGVGYASEQFRPDRALTQWELAALLASTQGMRLDPEKATKEERDSAYNSVYYLGALTREERNDDAPVTRAELVKALLRSAGYGSVAALRGIFTCAYEDSALIPEDDLGYAALAQGLGLAAGARYDGGAAATRAVAAVMLYRMMSA